MSRVGHTWHSHNLECVRFRMSLGTIHQGIEVFIPLFMNSLSLQQVVFKAKRAERLIRLAASIFMIIAVGGMIMLLCRLWQVRITDRQRANAAMSREVEEQKRRKGARPVANVIDLTIQKTATLH